MSEMVVECAVKSARLKFSGDNIGERRIWDFSFILGFDWLTQYEVFLGSVT